MIKINLANQAKSCHTCQHNARTNRGSQPCRDCRDNATLQDPKPHHKRKEDDHDRAGDAAPSAAA